jgi:hypothetical protein
MPELGKKYTCYSCHTKFYDLGKPVPLCPKCGADQRDSEETPIITSGRGRRIVEEVVEDDNDFAADAETPAVEGEEEEDAAPGPEADDADEEDDY